MKHGAFTLLLCSMLFCSCGTSLKVYVNNNSSYSRNNPITINNTNDVSGALGELQFLLQSNGYKLMSLDAAKKAINYDSVSGDNSYHGEITHTTQMRSAYVLKMEYTYREVINYYNFLAFSATITDLRTGEIIMTTSFRGDKRVEKVLKKFVEEMNQVIK